MIQQQWCSMHLKIANILLTFLGILFFCTVLCSTFFPFRMNDNYILLLPLSLSIAFISVFSLCMSMMRKNYFRFSIVDFLFVVLVIYYASRYDYQLQLANWKIIYAFLLALLWFAVRIIFSSFIKLNIFLIIASLEWVLPLLSGAYFNFMVSGIPIIFYFLSPDHFIIRDPILVILP